MPTIIGKIGRTIKQGTLDRVFSKVEIIDYQNNSAFIDFRNDMKPLIDALDVGQAVKVDFFVKAKLSNNQHPHNNIVATSLERL